MFKQKTYWHKVANSFEELESKIPPNKYYQLTVRGKRIIIGKGSKSLFALRNKCPHQGKLLSEGYHEEDKAVCIFHRFSFDVYSGIGSCGGVDNYDIVEKEEGIYLGLQYVSFLGF